MPCGRDVFFCGSLAAVGWPRRSTDVKSSAVLDMALRGMEPFEGWYPLEFILVFGFAELMLPFATETVSVTAITSTRVPQSRVAVGDDNTAQDGGGRMEKSVLSDRSEVDVLYSTNDSDMHAQNGCLSQDSSHRRVCSLRWGYICRTARPVVG